MALFIERKGAAATVTVSVSETAVSPVPLKAAVLVMVLPDARGAVLVTSAS